MQLNHSTADRYRVQDYRQMARYVCFRIPPDGTRVILTSGGEDGRPIYADLMPIDIGDGQWELEITTNEPEWATLEEVYDHFRCQDMTSLEWWQQATHVDPRRDYQRKVKSLSPKERKVFNTASETVPIVGIDLAYKLNYGYDGDTKGIFSLLVKIGLFTNVKGGYLRNPMPPRRLGKQ